MRLLAPLVLLALLAGCIELPAATTTEPEAAGAAYLTSAMGFATQAEPETKAVRAGSFFGAWAEGTDYPTWESEPFASGVMVDELELDLFVRATGPVPKTFRFPDIMAYGGAGGSWIGYGSAATDPLLVPGDVHRFTIAIEPPEGGLWVPAGERLGVKVVPVMMQGEVNDVELLVGGDTPSALSWTQRPAAFEPGIPSRGDERGEVTGSAYAGEAAQGSERHETRVLLHEAPTMLLAWLNTTSHEGIPDLDLEVIGPDGDVIASSGTPTPREFVRLGLPNLQGAGEYKLVTASYGSARASFTLEWQLS